MAIGTTPAVAETKGAAARERDHDRDSGVGFLKGAAEVFGAFYAALGGLAIGGFESWADRRAETRAERSRAPAAPERRRRAAVRARRG